ncbi:pirin family protein [Parasphingopyxis sp.]|uniref:pirin family protein n=1 Tax=Parasphingopyxis sp. TaxID=1920299 RepID=UPI00262CE451|nr:pirin family protein [Parasphingopyxis sp.]
MIEKRPFSSLGHADHGWLNARHHFSFANYYDPARMGWGSLRVWNDDEIAAKSGFPAHPHRDMEIVTYVRQGAITHRDSMGNEGRTNAGDVQVMSAGTGIQHSEFNLEDEETRLFQIWIEPSEKGGTPRWDAKAFPKGDRAGSLEVLASGFDQDILDGALWIRADARLSGATLGKGDTIAHELAEGFRGYLVVSDGKLSVNGVELDARDAGAISDVTELTIEALDDAEFLLAEVPDVTH